MAFSSQVETNLEKGVECFTTIMDRFAELNRFTSPEEMQVFCVGVSEL